MTTTQQAIDATKALIKALNGGSSKDVVAGVVDTLKHEHRYLQGQAVWALLEALGSLAGERTDPRNVHAIKACGTLREALGEVIYWKD